MKNHDFNDKHNHTHGHDHSHSHSHGHHHSHAHIIKSNSEMTKAFLWGIGLNVLYVIVEAIFGFIYNSMGLLSDAGHNLSDVAALVLSLIAVRLAMKKADSRFTYGYKKATVLISLLNALILFAAVGVIVYESIEKLITPEKVDGLAVAWVAGIGVLVNGATMLFFKKDKDGDLNVKGAYLHMMADALVSIGVVVSGIIIHFTNWYILDPIIGLAVAVIIVVSAWGLLKESVRLAVDAVPEGIKIDNIKEVMMVNPEVIDVHHIHIWPISTTENALTAHVRVSDIMKEEEVKRKIKKALAEEGISHATLEFEGPNTECCDDFIATD